MRACRCRFSWAKLDRICRDQGRDFTTAPRSPNGRVITSLYTCPHNVVLWAIPAAEAYGRARSLTQLIGQWRPLAEELYPENASKLSDWLHGKWTHARTASLVVPTPWEAALAVLPE